MRCEEVERELAAPSPGRDRGVMADHLAACPACSAWARDADRLDRLWEATRPAEPSAEAWDAVWSGISAALDGPSAAVAGPQAVPAFAEPGDRADTRPRSRPARRWRLGAIALVGLAQAAAILIAIGLAWQPTPRPDDADQPPQVADNAGPSSVPAPIRVDRPVRVDAEIEESSLVVIHAEANGARVVNATPPEMNTGSDSGLVFFNLMESLTTPHMAAR